MAEIWYLSLSEESDASSEPSYERSLIESIDLLELTPDDWNSPLDSDPELKTGNPLVDGSGYVYVFLKVHEDEVRSYGDEAWKPGWYKSSITIVGLEKKIRKKPK